MSPQNMKATGKRVLIMTSILIAVLVAMVWAFTYHTSEFGGGIGIRDTGFFSYPRYHAQVGDLPLWKNGEYLFTVHGLPPGPLDLALHVRDANSADRAQLTSLPIRASVSIADSDGKKICTASGSLSDAERRGLNSWVLTSSDISASFWHPSCQHLPISGHKTYMVKVTLSGADDRSPHKTLVPVLQGGGNELP
jgi:hypothetical protein